MAARLSSPASSIRPTFGELFTPKLVTVLREGYGSGALRRDAIAGLTVAIVALPLSMAIAIASGVTPERGLVTAIVGGFLISALGGSRYQIGGPAGAFIVLVAATVMRHGIDGLLLATLMSGVFMLAIGYARIGGFIKFIPYPVTVGFTAGIAVIILASQLRDLFGLTLAGAEPGPFVAKIEALAAAAGTVSPAACGVAFATVATILAIRRWRPGWPAMLIAVVAATLLATLASLPVDTIGTRFGGMPGGIPYPALPPVSLDRMLAVLPDAVSFAMLGSIESLLSAVVADGMTGRRHRSNCEIVAQGFANIASALFGGVPATGTIARTATNVRAGAHGPVAGMLHSIFLLAFLLIAAPLASYIPLAALAGVLVVVAWNMIELPAVRALTTSSAGDALVLVSTFLLVVLVDLTTGILVGFALGSVLFISRMSTMIAVEARQPSPVQDLPDRSERGTGPGDALLNADPDVAVYRISGAFFFGAAATVGAALDRVSAGRKVLILDFAAVPFLDSTGANVIEIAARKATRSGTKLFVSGATPQVRRMLFANGVRPPHVRYKGSLDSALVAASSVSGRAWSPHTTAL